jgi:tetratricopeptide (TPR) repeat protein
MGHRTALAILAWLAPAAALAEDASTRDPAVRATKLFDEARALLAQGKIAEACPVFEQSYALEPAPGTGLNVADCAERAGDVARARKLYEDAARAFDKAGKTNRANFARNRLANLDKAKPPEPPPKAPEPVEQGRVVARELKRETEGTVSAPENDHRVSKRVAIVGGALTLVSTGIVLYAGHTAREYQSGTGAVNAEGRPLGSRDCADQTPIAGNIEGFQSACNWRFASFFAFPTLVLAGTTTVVTLIYIAATPKRPAGSGLAVRPVMAPGTLGASLSLTF